MSSDAVPATSGELNDVPEALAYVPPGNVLMTYSPGAAIQASMVP
jgi:hypothetical protein